MCFLTEGLLVITSPLISASIIYFLAVGISFLHIIQFFQQIKTSTYSKPIAWGKVVSSLLLIFLFATIYPDNNFLLSLGVLAIVSDSIYIGLLHFYHSHPFEKINLQDSRSSENKRFEVLWKSNPSYVTVKDIKLRCYKNDYWIYRSNDGKYETAIYVVEGNILIEQAKGEVEIEHSKAGLDFIENILKQLGLENRDYYYIADTTGISKASLNSRKIVIEFHERHKNLKQFILITNSFTRVLLKLMTPINPAVINNWMTSDSVENALSQLFNFQNEVKQPSIYPETLLEKRIDQTYQLISLLSLKKFDEMELLEISEDDPFYGIFTALEILKKDNQEAFHELNTLLNNSYHTVKIQEIEILSAKYESLKNQINPHFLFNSLNVLTELVYTNRDMAIHFIQELSEIYRYILKCVNLELVKVDTELNFIKSFANLLKIRYGENLNIFIHDGNTETLMIPPLTLQLLVENCIKHNIITAEAPLSITIRIENSYLIVSNNLQVRKVHSYSSKLGLKSIQDRYKYLSDETVHIINDGKTFSIKLPLLKGRSFPTVIYQNKNDFTDYPIDPF